MYHPTDRIAHTTVFVTPDNILGSEMQLRGKNVHSWCDGSSDQSFMVDPSSYFLFQPVLHDWCNKGCVVLSCLWDNAYKRTLAANWKE